MKSGFMACALWLGLAAGANANDVSSAPECVGKDEYSPFDVLDSKTPPAIKQVAIETLVRLSNEPGCSYERYLLGTLHRYGPLLEGNPLPKDSARAVALLEQYALSGRPQAYADMAELTLADGDAKSAMLWTQVYLYLVARHAGSAFADFDRSGYNANLLLRVQKAWKKAKLGGPKDIEVLLDAYLQPRKSQLLEAMTARKPQVVPQSDRPGDDARIKHAPRGRTEIDLPIKPGYAIYLMEVQPDGRVSRIVAESFAPTPEHAKALRPFVDGFEYYPFKENKPQVRRVPVQYGYTGPYAPNLKSAK